MAYTNGSANTLAGLLTAVFDFAVSNAGFTQAGDWADGSWHITALKKNGVYYLFRENGTYLRMNMADGIAIGGTWGSQTNKATDDAYVDPLPAPYTKYHVFANNQNVRVAVECTPGRYNHFCFGEMTKVGTWTGGQFVVGQLMTSQSRFYDFEYQYHCRLFDGFYSTNSPGYREGILKIVHSGLSYGKFGSAKRHNALLVRGGTFVSPMAAELIERGPAPYNLRAPMLQCQVYLEDPDAGDQWRPLGVVEGVRSLNISALNPGDVVNNDWVVFPFAEKNGNADGWLNSGNWGLAFEK